MQEVIDNKKAQEQSEDERLCYVAISRAAYGFCCVSSFNHCEKETSFFSVLQNSLNNFQSNIVETSTDGFFTKTVYSPTEEMEIEQIEETEAEVILPVKYCSTESIAVALDKLPSKTTGETFGTLVHAIFEKSENNPEFQDFLQFCDVAEELGVEFETLFTELHRKVSSIERILVEKFCPQKILKEHEIVFNGRCLRLDCVYFCESDIVIIDYKTQKCLMTQEIQTQLEGYINAMEQIYQQPVRAFVVWFGNFPHLETLEQVFPQAQLPQ